MDITGEPPILVIEDEALIRLDLMHILEDAGFAVEAAVDGPKAEAAIDNRDHLVGIVTDINLGSDLKGWAVARHARKKFQNLAVVYITGDSAADWPTEGVPDSVILQKPFTDAQLVNAITSILEQAPARFDPGK